MFGALDNVEFVIESLQAKVATSGYMLLETMIKTGKYMTEEKTNNPAYRAEEMTLVDVATILVKRRRTFFVTFCLFAIAGICYAIFAPEKYEYTSLVQIAEKADGETIENPASTMASLVNQWVPEIEAAYVGKEIEKLPFDFQFVNPDDTGFIRIRSEARESVSEAVQLTHKGLLDRVMERQESLVAKERKALVQQITSLDNTIEALKGGQNTGAALAEAINQKALLDSQVESLRSAEVLVVARKSIEAVGIGSILVVAISWVLGAVVGFLLSLFSEFTAIVRSQLNKSE